MVAFGFYLVGSFWVLWSVWCLLVVTVGFGLLRSLLLGVVVWCCI